MQTPSTDDRLALLVRLSGAAAVLGLVVSVILMVALGRVSARLKTAEAPMRLISLQLAPTTDRAQVILASWGCGQAGTETAERTLCDAREALALDSWFIAAYVIGLGLAALWAGLAARLRRRLTVLAVLAIALAGFCDLAENWLHAQAIGGADSLPFSWVAPRVPGLLSYLEADTALHARAFSLARVAAMTKWALLLAGLTWVLGAAGGVLRRSLVRREDSSRSSDSILPGQGIANFAQLVQRETSDIFKEVPHRAPDTPECESHNAADEQYVSFRSADLIGLSLSGGGIRSATFSLGFLQGLQRLHLLALFDYLSTVSGGGYVGSFWSAWLTRRGANSELFPTVPPEGASPARPVDTDQERHLREFSRFLAPRLGFFEVEAWTAVVAVLAGLVPALLIGVSVIAVVLVLWLSFTFPVASRFPGALPLVVALITSVVLVGFERMWQVFKRDSAGNAAEPTWQEQDVAEHAQAWYRAFSMGAVATVALLQYLLPMAYAHYLSVEPWPIYQSAKLMDLFADQAVSQASDASGFVRWLDVAGIARDRTKWLLSPRLFDYGLVWIAGGLVCLLARFAHAIGQWKPETLAAFDRVVMRLLGLAVVWCGVAILWHIALSLKSLLLTAGAAASGAGAFAALRNWVGTALRRPSEVGLLDRLKPALPQVLAYATLATTVVLVGGGLVAWCGTDWWKWWQATAAASGMLVLGLFLKPDEFGLHTFYRDRLTRAYQGACNPTSAEAADNRGTEPRESDKLKLSRLPSRPLHLVCCSANDLSGDTVETLGRGARSAVLSKYGISMGSQAASWRPWSRADNLGSAVTASAAAFNSNMGHISARLGPVVSFLMTMLNLRLGLWVRHPAAQMPAPRAWPGLLFYREMVGLTSASGHITPTNVPHMLRDLHLSDGGHFENLALYELVRRHCRYIIVSDCGADPDVAFDDLGNAIRRIREDFGVDITLDVSSLRPAADGFSRQHVAVGTIHYTPDDRGILLYVKPSITGDEPADVLQYRSRNKAFPHEGTGDQFYDEAQWESYRRLGLHAAEEIFDFVAREDRGGRRDTADWVFAEASHRWRTTPEGLEDRVLEMTKRFGALESELNDRHATGLLSDVFPEIASVPESAKSPHTVGAAHEKRPDDRAPADDADAVVAAELAFLLRVTQLMEDAWLTCQLDDYWTHPLNLGWINLFARWATSSSFRFWWPLFAPMYSPGFQRFIQSRFPRRDERAGEQPRVANPHLGRVETVTTAEPLGLAATWWKERSTQPIPWLTPPPAGYNRTIYQNILDLSRNTGDKVPMQVGLAAVLTAPPTARGISVGWTSQNFFVPPSLWGAGIGWYFLSELLKEVAESAAYCHVVVKAAPEGLRDQVARDDRRSFIEQYKKIGFREARTDPSSGNAAPDPGLCADLGYDAAHDALLVLDLAQWKKQQSPEPSS